jgi:probable F420-dependent oxidoreductase
VIGHPDLGRIGVWIGGPPSPELARGLDELGYGAIWIGGSQGGELEGVERTLAATSRLTVATGIVNIWKDDPAVIAASYHRLADEYPGRFLLGVGAGHPEETSRYTKP